MKHIFLTKYLVFKIIKADEHARISNLLIIYKWEVLFPNKCTDIFFFELLSSGLCPLSNILQEHVFETGAVCPQVKVWGGTTKLGSLDIIHLRYWTE
jgi:hypothetical protein